MERGDVYLVTLDPISGREQQGPHPFSVVSVACLLTRSLFPC